MNIYYLITGIVALLSGLLLSSFINKRRFNRRNVAGLQQFSSYEKSMMTRFIERIGKLIAYLLIAIGLFILAGTYLGKYKKDHWEKAIPHSKR